MNVFPQNPAALVVVVNTTIELVPQVSLAVGGSNVQAVEHSTDLLGAQAIVGGVVSTTATICVQVLVLAQSLLASQVRVARKVLPQRKLVTVLNTVTEGMFVPVPLVTTVGGSKVHATPHSTVLLVEQASTGGLVLTVEQTAVKKFETVRPNSSVPHAQSVSVAG